MSEDLITHDDLRSILSYHPLTGEFRWKKNIGKHRTKNKVAGTITSNGYIHITINKRKYLAHRLAFFYMNKRWPTNIDHIDGNKTNNNINNLRECTSAQNSLYYQKNVRGDMLYIRIDERANKKYRVLIDNKNTRFSKYYKTIEEAQCARDEVLRHDI